jgi:hypothetical protein
VENNMIGLKKSERGTTTLYCFSPPVMIATFIIEITLAIYVFIKSRKAGSDVGIVVILVFLAIFQLSEYQICGGLDALLWSRIGLFAITFLPVLGLYLITKLKKDSHLLRLGFFVAIAFVTFFVLVPQSVTGATCGGNYVVFDISHGLSSLYGYYYFGFMLLGIWEALSGIRTDNVKTMTKKALFWFIIGYLSFILPLTLVYIFLPVTRVAITSVMCGFAVIFAFILTFKIAPIYHKYVKVEPITKESVRARLKL